MPTAAENFRDGILRRQVGLHRLTRREVEAVVRQLRETERRVYAELRRRLEIEVAFGVDRGPATTRRLRILLADIRALLIEGYAEIGDKLQLRLFDMTGAEAEANRRLLVAALPREIRAHVSVGVPSVELLREIVSRRPFMGGLLRQYFQATGKHSLVKVAIRRYRKAIMGDVRSGLIEGKTVEAVVRLLIRRVRGLTRNDLRAVTDTAMKSATSAARDAFMESNAGEAGVVKGRIWENHAAVTKDICIPRHGKAWRYVKGALVPAGHSLSWLSGPGRSHWRCKAVGLAWLKSWKELGIPARELSGQTRATMNGARPFVPPLETREAA